MNIFRRAMINIIRQPLKNISLLILVTILGAVLLSGISLSRAMIVTEDRLLMQLPTVTTLVYDGQSQYGWSQPNQTEITLVGELPYVRAYDFTLRTHFHSQTLQWIDSMNPGFFTTRGVNNPNITDIDSGLIHLTDGRVFTQEEINNNALVMVIPKSVATVNGLSVGSTVEIANIANDYRYGDWSDRFNENFILEYRMLEFEIIGIFTPHVDEDESYFREPIFFLFHDMPQNCSVKSSKCEKRCVAVHFMTNANEICES